MSSLISKVWDKLRDCDDNVELEDDGDIFVDKNINIKMI